MSNNICQDDKAEFSAKKKKGASFVKVKCLSYCDVIREGRNTQLIQPYTERTNQQHCSEVVMATLTSPSGRGGTKMEHHKQKRFSQR